MYLTKDFQQLTDTIKASSREEGEKKMLLSKLTANLNSFVDYFNHVVRSEIEAAAVIQWSPMTEFMFKKRDAERRELHNTCIIACKEIDYICETVGCEPICRITDENDRHKVAELCGIVVGGLYLSGIHSEKTFDKLVEEFKESKERLVHKEDINDWEL